MTPTGGLQWAGNALSTGVLPPPLLKPGYKLAEFTTTKYARLLVWRAERGGGGRRHQKENHWSKTNYSWLGQGRRNTSSSQACLYSAGCHMAYPHRQVGVVKHKTLYNTGTAPLASASLSHMKLSQDPLGRCALIALRRK